MHPFLPVIILYALITLGSACTFYFAFRKHVDASGRYFLLAEVSTLLMLSILLVTTGQPALESQTYWLGNFFGLAVDVSILMSIYSLDRSVKLKWYVLALGGLALYCTLIEIMRTLDPRSPIVFYSVATFLLACWTASLCKWVNDAGLKRNQFLTCIKWIEIIIAIFSLFRIAGYFLGVTVTPRHPTPLAVMLFAVYAALVVFRYISYQSLRISWVDLKTRSANPLNQQLAQAITEKDHLLRGLIASNRVLGISALASSLAHQISQPLTAISLQTETLKRDLAKSSDHEKHLKTIDKVAYQLSELSALVKNLRRLFNSRDDAFEAVDLKKITNEILAVIEPSLKAKKIKLTKTCHTYPKVLGDAIQIQQVVINLFNNAIEAIHHDNATTREIKLTVSSDNAFATLSIQDSGSGIPQSQLPNLFELYQTTKKDGLGVGLWLSKTIIDRHHGTISAANHVNGGAIFTLQIPLAPHKSS